ncbi:hypothetical protein CERZMDRAFT_88832 [Cercospora zeae-maydis SCOH1-5]|uniref:Uncharacterized protein n=1 Tax=Cercospora zeae-maydis SCOH1-5 TaxID=717836 RepID=A0A6A6F1K7_9PEZI|nr:hypothetical protein CERZMDRAFT_88832 [Cercospora zeae-maydis SCOH1-5]
MCVDGFLVPMNILNPFWKDVLHYIDYRAYVFQGMMVNEFKERTYNCPEVDGQYAALRPGFTAKALLEVGERAQELDRSCMQPAYSSTQHPSSAPNAGEGVVREPGPLFEMMYAPSLCQRHNRQMHAHRRACLSRHVVE